MNDAQADSTVTFARLRDRWGCEVGVITMLQREADAFVDAATRKMARSLFYGESVDARDFARFRSDVCWHKRRA